MYEVGPQSLCNRTFFVALFVLSVISVGVGAEERTESDLFRFVYRIMLVILIRISAKVSLPEFGLHYRICYEFY